MICTVRFSGHPDLAVCCYDDDFKVSIAEKLPSGSSDGETSRYGRRSTQHGRGYSVSAAACRACVQKKLGQGLEERPAPPGTPTFGHAFEEYQRKQPNTVASRGRVCTSSRYP